jgi:DNA-binding MarR family transcriptional regulator
MFKPRGSMLGDKIQNGAMDNESEITLGLLNAVHADSDITQRSIASELGIALGLANAYLKRCVRKGYIKVGQIPRRRYAYYLTPQGFAEKTRLTSEYLSYSFTFFRAARTACAEQLARCEARQWRRVALAGVGDLAEIATLCARDSSVELCGIVDPDFDRTDFAGLPVVPTASGLAPVDAVMVTDVTTPHETYAALRDHFAEDRVLAPDFLHIMHGGASSGDGA